MSASSPAALAAYGAASLVTLATVWLLGQWLLPHRNPKRERGPLADAPALAHASGRDAPAEEQIRWQRTTMPLALLALFNLALAQSDVLLLGMLCDTRTAGIYSVAVRLAGLVSFALVVMSSVLAPLWAELHATNQTTAMRRLAAVASLGLVIATLPVAALLVLCGVPILSWFGADFAAGYPALAILCGGQLLNALAGPVCQLLTMSGRQNVAAKVLGVFAVIHFVLAACLIWQFSLVGAALATSIATIGWNVTLAWYVRRELGVDSTIFSLRQLFRSTAHA
jgi:O-antigen/teichoic acid export membrane protein